MLKNVINNYLQKSIWLSERPINITEQDSLMFRWLTDSRLNLSFNRLYRLTTMVKLREKDIAGIYYMQAIDLDCDNIIDDLVITDERGDIVEEFIFKLEENTLNGEIIARRIQNREQRIVNDILKQLELTRDRNNMRILLELIFDLELKPFTKTLTLSELRLLKLLINFNVNNVKTDGKLDFRKINFLLERLNNPWSAPEARTILQFVNNYKYVNSVKEAENIFIKLGGIKNIGLIIHQGKYHPQLISIVKEYDLDSDGLIKTIVETKKAVIELGI